MRELPDQLRHYYHGAALPGDTVRQMLAQGRRQRRQRLIGWATLAVVAAVAFGAIIQAIPSHPLIDVADVKAEMRVVFARGDARLALLSNDTARVRRWIEARGGPADFAVPRGLAGRSIVGCDVFSAAPVGVFVVCFGDEAGPLRQGASVGGAQPLHGATFHLAIVPKSQVREAARIMAQPRVEYQGLWSFATWSDGVLVYVLATNAGAEHLKQALDHPVAGSASGRPNPLRLRGSA